MEIKSHLVIRVALWIIGEYAETNEEIQQAFQTIKKNIGSLPIFPLVTEDLDIPAQQSEEAKEPKVITKTIVLPDGSYGTQTIVVDDQKSKAFLNSQDECSYLALRNALVNADDDYLASCLAVTLTKLAIKAKKRLSLSYKAMSVDSILIMCSMLKERTIQKD